MMRRLLKKLLFWRKDADGADRISLWRILASEKSYSHDEKKKWIVVGPLFRGTLREAKEEGVYRVENYAANIVFKEGRVVLMEASVMEVREGAVVDDGGRAA